MDSNPSTGQSTFGIAIEFEEPPEIELGNLRLQLFTDDPYSWVNAKNSGTAKNYHTGVAFYFANWDQTDYPSDPEPFNRVGRSRFPSL